MKRFVFLLALCGLAAPAFAQMVASTRPVCERRCSKIEFEGNPETALHLARLARIREQKKLETDPDKLKLLAEQEEDELDRRDAFIGKLCRHICRNNPEE